MTLFHLRSLVSCNLCCLPPSPPTHRHPSSTLPPHPCSSLAAGAPSSISKTGTDNVILQNAPLKEQWAWAAWNATTRLSRNANGNQCIVTQKHGPVRPTPVAGVGGPLLLASPKHPGRKRLSSEEKAGSVYSHLSPIISHLGRK